MEHKYLSTKSNQNLRNINESGIFPSPYNFVGERTITIDEYVINDSTLREGEQTPGVNFRAKDKLRIAEKLNDLGVRRFEAGFPAASEKQMQCVRAITGLDLDAQIFAFSRATKRDIDAVAESGAQGIIVCFSVSQFHRKNKFKGMTKDEYLERLSHWISYAEDKGLFVIYSGEDTSRERDLGFLKEAYRTAEEAGADGARIIDTLGCLSPDGATYLVREIGRSVNIPLEVHFHNDMGLALANSMAAVGAGASGISTCVNGLGERAGIVATEEAIAALHILYGVDYFELGRLTELSRFIENLTQVGNPPQKPITGENVLTHSSGIHQHGVFKNPVTYEFYPTGLFGQERRIELDELSGRHGVIYVARNILGMDVSEMEAESIIDDIKSTFSLEGRQVSYSPQELRALIEQHRGA